MAHHYFIGGFLVGLLVLGFGWSINNSLDNLHVLKARQVECETGATPGFLVESRDHLMSTDRWVCVQGQEIK